MADGLCFECPSCRRLSFRLEPLEPFQAGRLQVCGAVRLTCVNCFQQLTLQPASLADSDEALLGFLVDAPAVEPVDG